MVALSLIIEEIQEKYSDSYPNGLLAGWDSNRFFQELVLVFSDCKVFNQTDFNYSYCNSYDVDLGSKGGISFTLTIKASYIYDAFSLHVTRYINRQGEVLLLRTNDFIDKVELARTFFLAKGFREIQPYEMDVEIDGVNLELTEIATVGKCLFDDFE